MMLRKNHVIAFAVVGLFTAGSASADIISYTWPEDEERTEIDQNSGNLLQKFDPSLGTLNSVTFSVDGSATTTITLTNTAAQEQSLRAATLVELYFSGIPNPPAPLITLTMGTGLVTLDPLETRIFGPLSDLEIVSWPGPGNWGIPANSWFVGTGPLTLGCSSLTGLTVTGGGGNIDARQATTAGCSAEVTYNYTPTPPQAPEPASIALMGLGLAGLGVWRRRKA